jgi:hypothetical protein
MRRWPALVLIVAACGGEDEQQELGPHPLWQPDPQSVENPLPDDRLRSDARIVMRPEYWRPFVPPAGANEKSAPVFTANAEHFADQDGWGTSASVLVPFSAPLDEASITEQRFVIVPVDPAGPRVKLHTLWHAETSWVELAPDVAMAPATRYVVVVRSGLTSAGTPVVAPLGVDAAAIAAGAAALSIPSEEVLLAFFFTTAHVRDELLQAAGSLAGVVPVADFSAVPDNERWPRGIFDKAEFIASFDDDPETQAQVEAGLEHAGRVAVGTYGSRDYRTDGVFDPAFVTGAAPPPEVDLEFILVEPDPAEHPPPWPVTIVQHGFNGSAKDVLTRAAMFNEEGIAAIGIDALEHGLRGSILNFFSPEDVRRARENLRQTALDHIQLCRLAIDGGIDIDGQTGDDLDGRCNYFGQSLGGILGGLYAAVSPDTEVAVLDVPGGGLSRVLQSPVLGPQVSIIFQPALGYAGDPETYVASLPFFSFVAQTLIDPGDPVNFGPVVLDPPPYAQPERRVLVQVGVGDNIIPNETSRALVTAIGLVDLDAAKNDPTGVSGAWWVDPADFGVTNPDVGGDTDPHNILNFIPGVRRQAAVYQRSEGTEIADPASF